MNDIWKEFPGYEAITRRTAYFAAH